MVVNCTTLSEHLLESELFGHMRGAFTGAVKDKPGRLEAADGGTVFLDEIADLSVALQTKFLRFMQEQSFERVGGAATIEVDARIIAASNRELEAGSRSRPLPRRSILPSQRDHFVCSCLARAPGGYPVTGRTVSFRRRDAQPPPGLRFSPEAEPPLCRYRWPGNVRELRNAIERAVVLSRGETIKQEDLPDSIFRPQAGPRMAPEASSSLEEVERDHIRRVLTDAVTLEEAADTLGISVATLWRKRKRYGIE